MGVHLKLDFNAQEDRMVFTLQAPQQVHRYWLTRRQCVGLVLACRRVMASLPNLPALARAEKTGRPSTAAPEEEAISVQPTLTRVAVRRQQQTLALTFSGHGEAPQTVRLGPAEQLRLLRHLRRLAERARWDLNAAIARQAAQRVRSDTGVWLH